MKTKKLFSVVSGLLLGSVLAFATVLVKGAGTASFSLNPASGLIKKGNNITVSVYEDSGSEQINFVSANLNYEQTKLQYVGIDTSLSAFNVPAISSGGSGKVSLERGSTGPLSGKQLIGKITFKTLVSSGSSAVAFDNSSYIVNYVDHTNIWNGATAGGTYSFAPTSISSSTNKPNDNSKSTSTGSSASAGALSALTENNVNQQKASPSTPVSADKQNTSTVPAYLVGIRVVDSAGQNVQGVSVTINMVSALTDSTGVASFNGVPAGTYVVTVKKGQDKATEKITIDASKPKAEQQQFTIRLTKVVLSLDRIVLGTGIGLAVLAVLILLMLLIHWLKGKTTKGLGFSYKGNMTNLKYSPTHVGSNKPEVNAHSVGRGGSSNNMPVQTVAPTQIKTPQDQP